MSKAPVISVVDDDESVRVATTCLMRSMGYTAHSFASAEEFLRSPQLEETSCLIADVQMPCGLSGIELHRKLEAEGRRLPVILISAFPEERLKARIVEVGPGRPLRGFFKAVGVGIDSVTDLRSATRAFAAEAAA